MKKFITCVLAICIALFFIGNVNAFDNEEKISENIETKLGLIPMTDAELGSVTAQYGQLVYYGIIGGIAAYKAVVTTVNNPIGKHVKDEIKGYLWNGVKSSAQRFKSQNKGFPAYHNQM